MNFLNPLSRTRFSNGAAKVRIFFKPASVSGKIFDFFLETLRMEPMRQSCEELSARRFSNGSAKVRLFSLLPNLFRQPEARTGAKDTSPACQNAGCQGHIGLLRFC